MPRVIGLVRVKLFNQSVIIFHGRQSCSQGGIHLQAIHKCNSAFRIQFAIYVHRQKMVIIDPHTVHVDYILTFVSHLNFPCWSAYPK
jgi:hypothetical protein